MPIDLAEVRAETPGVGRVIHFHHSGAALMPRRVLEAVKSHLDLEAEIGGYEAEEEAADKIKATYNAVARLLRCSTDEVALMENATTAWNTVFYALASTFEPGDRILTAVAEYASNYLAYLQVSERTGVQIDVVPDDQYGQLDVTALESMVDARVRLISVTHVPTNSGLVNPAAEVGAFAKKHGIFYLLDACQSAGQLPLDVDVIGCDALSATGRKYVRGPRGTGFLYVRRSKQDLLPPPTIDLRAATWVSPTSYELRADARRYENWESSIAGQIGLGVAVDYALSIGLETIYERIRHLADRLRQQLSALPHVTVRDKGVEKCGIVTFTHANASPEEIQTRLQAKRINVGRSGRSATLLDMDARGLKEIVRAPVHYYNTEDEVDKLVEAVAAL